MKTFKNFVTEAEEVEQIEESYTLKLTKTTKPHTTDDEDNPVPAIEKHYDIHHKGKKVGKITHHYNDYGGHFFDANLHGKRVPYDRHPGKEQNAKAFIAAISKTKWHSKNIKEEVMAEMDSEGYKGYRGNEDPGKGPEQVVKAVKSKHVTKDAAKTLTKAMVQAHKKQGVAEEVDQIDEDEKMIGRHGFTEIYRKGKNTIIAHGGNMGNTVANSVKPNVDKILGKGKFDKLKKHGIEKGSPDYSYAMTIPNKHFDSIHKIQESVESIDEVAAWQRSEGKNPEGGLNKKGIQSYRREHPGSKLSLAVTTKPSKLKKGSKAWNRRKSFCARMSGMKRRLTSAKTAHDPDSRINKSLRKWNC